MSLNSSANQTTKYNNAYNALQAGLTAVTAEVAVAQAAYTASPTAQNGAILAAVTLEQTNLNYQISLMVPNSVSGTATEGFQTDDTTAYQPQWFPK